MRRMFSEEQLERVVKNTPKGIESLVDSQGHNRFIEGDIEIEEITGVTQTYGKWSLSGTHLMCVIAGTIANETAFASTTALCYFEIPKFIYDKIIPLYAERIEQKAFTMYNGTDGTNQSCAIRFGKSSSQRLYMQITPFTATADRIFRYVFDLLIDNE